MRTLRGILIGLLLGGSFAYAVNPVPFDIINLTTGLRIGGAATSGQFLRGNGTNFVSSNIAAATDLSGSLCAASQILKKNAGNTAWECAADGGGSTLPVADTTSIVEGSADATKEIRFEVDGLTTATVRVLTPPDANIVIAGSASALTSGRIPVVTTSGLLTDTANLAWDNTNFRLRGQNLTTATDNTTNMFQLSGTMPTTPTALVQGIGVSITSAGSASFGQEGLRLTLNAGYTGNQFTAAITGANAAVATGTALGLNANFGTTGNFGFLSQATGSGAGNQFGIKAEGQNSTGLNAGGYLKAAAAVAGTNFGALLNAANSTEATDLKNVPLYATLSSSLITGSNIDAVSIFDNGTVAASMARMYDAGVLMFNFADGGTFVASRTTDLGWTPVNAANQACNTTCTSACVAGLDTAAVGNFLACTDATADTCLCAGAS